MLLGRASGGEGAFENKNRKFYGKNERRWNGDDPKGMGTEFDRKKKEVDWEKKERRLIEEWKETEKKERRLKDEGKRGKRLKDEVRKYKKLKGMT